MRPPRPQPKPAPARIWGFVASEAPRIVLLRRGPSKWTQMWLWHTDTDEFEAGSWFAGHIFYLLCDLSPNGEYFVYGALNPAKYKQEKIQERFGIEKLPEWTSLCRPPCFNSLGLWAGKKLRYFSGGSFVTSTHLALTEETNSQALITAPDEIAVSFDLNENPFLSGMQRTGWQNIPERWQAGHMTKQSLTLSWEVFLSVSKFEQLHYTYPAADLSGVSWADLDQQGHLVYARQGCIYRHTDAGEQLLADLNASQPHRPWLNEAPQHKEKTAPEGDFSEN